MLTYVLIVTLTTTFKDGHQKLNTSIYKTFTDYAQCVESRDEFYRINREDLRIHKYDSVLNQVTLTAECREVSPNASL